MQRLRDYKSKVRAILEEFPNARNNDGVLIAHFLYKHHRHLLRRDTDGNICIPLKYLKDVSPLNTITRARRIVQNDDGEFLPTSAQVRKLRRIKEEQWRNWEVREAQNYQG